MCLMVIHAGVNIVHMAAAHRAADSLRFRNLRRKSEDEDCSDYTRNADAVANHVSKL